MLKLNAPLEVELTRFFRWWGETLVSIIPQKLRIKRSKIILFNGADGVHARYHDASGALDLGEFSLDEAGGLKREQVFAKIPELKDAECFLMLSPGQFLHNIAKLPLAAEENLNQVMGFEMDRLSPFKADQVYFDARVQKRCHESRRIDVEWSLTPKHKLDSRLEALSGIGFYPARVDLGVVPEGLGFNLLPEQYRQKQDAWPMNLSLGLFGGLSIAVLLLPILMSRSALLDLQQQSRALSKTVREVESLREEVEKLEHEAGFLMQKKRAEPAMLDMLNELSRVIPDSTWLNGLQYRDHKLIIQGQSPAASSLIEQIEKSPYFKNTSFVSPVTKDVGGTQERFQIASEALNGRFSEKKAD